MGVLGFKFLIDVPSCASRGFGKCGDGMASIKSAMERKHDTNISLDELNIRESKTQNNFN